MSRLITSGDTTENFGKFLPAPYIDKIYLNSDGQVDYDLHVYIRVSENTDVGALLNSLSGVKLYAALVLDADFEKVLSGEEDLWFRLLANITDYSDGRGGINPSSSEPDDFGWIPIFEHAYNAWTGADSAYGTSTEIMYDDAGNRTLKITWSTLDTSDGYTDGAIEYNVATSSSTWYFVAFTAIPFNDTFASSIYPELATNDYFGEDDLTKPTHINRDKLLSAGMSDISYEKIWDGSAIPTGEEAMWEDETGSVFDGTPLRSLSSQYYSTATITAADIVSSFKELSAEYETLATSDEILQSTLDQISYILETKAESEDLLTELNTLRRTFPSKSSTDDTGKLYARFQKKISAANKALEAAPQVGQTVVKNVKVVDWYNDLDYEYTQPSTSYDVADGTFSFNPFAQVDSDYDVIGKEGTAASVVGSYTSPSNCVGGAIMSLTSHEGTGAPAAWDTTSYCRYGWFFFDYDKALYESSILNEYMNMELAYTLLGRNLLNKHFYVEYAVYQRFYGDEGFDASGDLLEHGCGYADPDRLAGEACAFPWAKMTATIEQGYKTTSVAHEAVATDPKSSAYVQDMLGNTSYSFIILRNFQVARDGGNDGYRIMGFEIQDWDAGGCSIVESRESDHGEDTWFTVGVKDTTDQIIVDLISLYNLSMAREDEGSLREYVDRLDDYAYNENTESFSDSFIAEMEEKYAGTEADAPWNLYPMLYIIFVDLISQYFDGDIDAIGTAASAIASTIHPATATRDTLERFQTDFENFYADYLDSTSGDTTPFAEVTAGNDSALNNKEYMVHYNADGLYRIAMSSRGSVSDDRADPYAYPLEQTLDETAAYTWNGTLDPEAEVSAIFTYCDGSWLEPSDSTLADNEDPCGFPIDVVHASSDGYYAGTLWRIYVDAPLYYYVENDEGDGYELKAIPDGTIFEDSCTGGWADVDGTSGCVNYGPKYSFFSMAIQRYGSGTELMTSVTVEDSATTEMKVSAVYTIDTDKSPPEYYFAVTINDGDALEAKAEYALIFNPNPEEKSTDRIKSGDFDASAFDTEQSQTVLTTAFGNILELGRMSPLSSADVSWSNAHSYAGLITFTMAEEEE